jgi:hypothetical protein
MKKILAALTMAMFAGTATMPLEAQQPKRTTTAASASKVRPDSGRRSARASARAQRPAQARPANNPRLRQAMEANSALANARSPARQRTRSATAPRPEVAARTARRAGNAPAQATRQRAAARTVTFGNARSVTATSNGNRVRVRDLARRTGAGERRARVSDAQRRANRTPRSSRSPSPVLERIRPVDAQQAAASRAAALVRSGAATRAQGAQSQPDGASRERRGSRIAMFFRSLFGRGGNPQ